MGRRGDPGSAWEGILRKLLATTAIAVTLTAGAPTAPAQAAEITTQTLAYTFVFALAGSDFVLEAFRGWAPAMVVDIVAGFGFLTHFQAIARGVIDLRDAIFFGSTIALALFANALIVDLKKAD